jgi:hypothetical protein
VASGYDVTDYRTIAVAGAAAPDEGLVDTAIGKAAEGQRAL